MSTSPTSAVAAWYDDAVAPEMVEQFVDGERQRDHWKEKVIGVKPRHTPVVDVSVVPTTAFPVITGGELGSGLPNTETPGEPAALARAAVDTMTRATTPRRKTRRPVRIGARPMRNPHRPSPPLP